MVPVQEVGSRPMERSGGPRGYSGKLFGGRIVGGEDVANSEEPAPANLW